MFNLAQKKNKKLSYRSGTARGAMLVNSCCFTSYVSYKGFKQQKWYWWSFKGMLAMMPFDRPYTISYESSIITTVCLYLAWQLDKRNKMPLLHVSRNTTCSIYCGFWYHFLYDILSYAVDLLPCGLAVSWVSYATFDLLRTRNVFVVQLLVLKIQNKSNKWGLICIIN